MILSSEDLPEPLAPRTPILAPGNIEMLMPRSTSLSGGWTRRRSRMLKMNCAGMPSTVPVTWPGAGGSLHVALRKPQPGTQRTSPPSWFRGLLRRRPPAGGLACEHRGTPGHRLHRPGLHDGYGHDIGLLPHPGAARRSAADDEQPLGRHELGHPAGRL